jgi:GTPase SAR1 family protein
MDDVKIKLQIWDTAGQERFRYNNYGIHQMHVCIAAMAGCASCSQWQLLFNLLCTGAWHQCTIEEQWQRSWCLTSRACHHSTQ